MEQRVVVGFLPGGLAAYRSTYAWTPSPSSYGSLRVSARATARSRAPSASGSVG
ncbi:hypothetical protein [Streptomyces sp. NBC_00057]|uniref:hypothetical protein n=1 Tax=Streptomyces sp. NBC_00057 TaxID=2975634 RepID=UPI003253B349